MSYPPLGDDTEDVDTAPVTAATVRARVQDWRERIDALYRSLQEWSPEGYVFHTQQHLTMHEEMMKNFGIESVELPVLNVFNNEGWKAKVIPYGLWIIGANGRLDLLTNQSRYVITGLESGWRISEPRIHRHAKDLTPSLWLKVLQ